MHVVPQLAKTKTIFLLINCEPARQLITFRMVVEVVCVCGGGGGGGGVISLYSLSFSPELMFTIDSLLLILTISYYIVVVLLM